MIDRALQINYLPIFLSSVHILCTFFCPTLKVSAWLTLFMGWGVGGGGEENDSSM